ncbi:MAG TPA: hypothetical protein VKR55_02335 [Bradyrhizobium sp.]|uniref:hypothetical protein n=1 Tax=Bradyrhizobium sp. TaxID=376 RepID=UPI002CCBB4F6|nr:hypothetical protein [Bradyrhizobium sp.]HLZ00972.1 hypothetical protein [Bradyrhizobium sp.]
MFGLFAIQLLQVVGAAWRQILIRKMVSGIRSYAGMALMPPWTRPAHVVAFGPVAHHGSGEPAPQRCDAAEAAVPKAKSPGLRTVSLIAKAGAWSRQSLSLMRRMFQRRILTSNGSTVTFRSPVADTNELCDAIVQFRKIARPAWRYSRRGGRDQTEFAKACRLIAKFLAADEILGSPAHDTLKKAAYASPPRSSLSLSRE